MYTSILDERTFFHTLDLARNRILLLPNVKRIGDLPFIEFHPINSIDIALRGIICKGNHPLGSSAIGYPILGPREQENFLDIFKNAYNKGFNFYDQTVPMYLDGCKLFNIWDTSKPYSGKNKKLLSYLRWKEGKNVPGILYKGEFFFLSPDQTLESLAKKIICNRRTTLKAELESEQVNFPKPDYSLFLFRNGALFFIENSLYMHYEYTNPIDLAWFCYACYGGLNVSKVVKCSYLPEF